MQWFSCFCRRSRQNSNKHAYVVLLSKLHISVIGWERTTGNSPSVVYRTIVVCNDDYHERLIRYRDFRAFHKKTKLYGGGKMKTTFPTQGYWFWNRETKEIIEARQITLNEYMQEICRSKLTSKTLKALNELLHLEVDLEREIDNLHISGSTLTMRETDMSIVKRRSMVVDSRQIVEEENSNKDSESLDSDDNSAKKLSPIPMLQAFEKRDENRGMLWIESPQKAASGSMSTTETEDSESAILCVSKSTPRAYKDLLSNQLHGSTLECESSFSSPTEQNFANDISTQLKLIKSELECCKNSAAMIRQV